MWFFSRRFSTPLLNSVNALFLDRIRSHRSVLFIRWRLMFLKICRAEQVQSCSRAGRECSEQSTARGAGSRTGMLVHSAAAC